MLHSRQITLATGGSAADTTKTKFTVNKGVIYQLWVGFPKGCKGLVKVRIFYQSHAFIPVEEDQYLRGDGYTYEIQPMFEIKTEPEIITVEAWNEDEKHTHTIDIQMNIIQKMWILPAGIAEGIIASLKSIFQRR